MPEDTMTAVQWLRAFAQDLEDSHICPYENVQILRRLAKYVDELEQGNRDAVRYTGEVKNMLLTVNKIMEIYEERDLLHKKLEGLLEHDRQSI